ncbi:transmembrane protein 92 [Anguilla anguilla]|uniref:Transmembrane protein 92 n=1 Tax=Anguilla anguilla TaxID=7936 RepID=A0A9D3LKZ8_ANGAN|nr:transmembrane protein 92 [Anguilla anguilla]XP_035252923.1 transmembrane protein 92 [Anguilla anguilla]KAG5832381.1 hypothetical protein ANANG_G00290580 [Anguilla anguilla]
MVVDTFPFLEVFMPFVGFGIVVLCCTPLCRACHSFQESRHERVDSPSVYIIPFPAEERAHSPPRYSTAVFASPAPPPYAEVEMKPELFPHPEDVPPPYTEVDLPLPSTAPLPPTAPPQPRSISL